MTKIEAIEAMQKGSRLVHRYFSSNEWMEIRDNKIHFEDGVICSMSEFFSQRSGKEWENGYAIINK